MENLKFNIGLNVGKIEPKNQMKATFFALVESDMQISDVRVDTGGEYVGMKERTFICDAITLLPREELIAMITFLCDSLGQESIAVKINGIGELIYCSNFKGEKYEFNQDYFIE